MAFIQDGSGAGAAKVDANTQLAVATNVDPTKAGFARIASENDPGGSARAPYCYSPETSDDYRLRVAIDTLEDFENFNYANQQSSKHKHTATTLVFDLNGGFLRTNSAGITTINTAANFQTSRLFPLWGQQTPINAEFCACLDAALTTNTNIEFGLFIPNAASPYTPTDGVFIRVDNSGFKLVVSYNGSETSAALTDGNGVAFTHTINRVYSFVLVCNNRETKVWIDDVLYADIDTQVGNGAPLMAQSVPLAITHRIGGVAAGASLRLKVSQYSVQTGDIAKAMPFAVQAVGMGNGMQVQQGATVGGQLTNYPLGAAPGVVTLTANTAPATNNLGGLQLLPAAITAGESDYPLFAWLNPAGTTAIPGKRFFCTSIRVADAMIYPTALTGGPLIIQWAVGWGSTAASLATTESASFAAATTKIARKHPIGTQTFPAAAIAGTVAAGFQIDFSSAPLCINPGEYLHIIIRCLGTNTTAGTPRVACTPIGFFE